MGTLLSETQFNGSEDTSIDQSNKGDDTSSASSAGQTTEHGQIETRTVGSEGKKDGAGLADHPRWKEREEDWKERYNKQEVRYQESLAAIRSEIQGLKSSAPASKEETPPATETEIPDWFAGDQEAWNKYQAHEEQRIQRYLESVHAKEMEQKTAETKRVEEATQFFNEQVASIESDNGLNPQGEKVDHNKLLKFVMDNDLVDSQGRWNYRAGYRMMKASSQGSSDDGEARRKLAAATTGKGSADGKPSSVTTSDYFRKEGRRPW